jgi:alpha-1,2-mannosyltransferase
MTLVIADAVPRRTPWPRGLLLGVAIALKLTPAVFLLYFLLRRDTRALIVAAASAVAATLVGGVLAWQDSFQYWTRTVHDTDRIGTATLNTNQNIAGTLARFGLADTPRFVVWVVASFAVLALVVWAANRVLKATGPEGSDARAGEAAVLALVCVAMFGLIVSPVSWSHHWVWTLPTILVTTVVAYRHRNIALAAVTAAGLALLIWTPITLMPKHHETSASLLRQLAGDSYLWWAIVVIVVIGSVAGAITRPAHQTRRAARDAAPVVAAN